MSCFLIHESVKVNIIIGKVKNILGFEYRDLPEEYEPS